MTTKSGSASASEVWSKADIRDYLSDSALTVGAASATDTATGFALPEPHPDPIIAAGGIPDASTLPSSELEAAFGRILNGKPDVALRYGGVLGFEGLREAMAERMAVLDGMSFEPDNFIIHNGGSGCLDNLCQAFITPGDVVIVEEPSYSGTTRAIRGHMAELMGVTVEDDGISVDGVADAIQRAKSEGKRVKFVYLNPDFQNPTGTTLNGVTPGGIDRPVRPGAGADSRGRHIQRVVFRRSAAQVHLLDDRGSGGAENRHIQQGHRHGLAGRLDPGFERSTSTRWGGCVSTWEPARFCCTCWRSSSLPAGWTPTSGGCAAFTRRNAARWRTRCGSTASLMCGSTSMAADSSSGLSAWALPRRRCRRRRLTRGCCFRRARTSTLTRRNRRTPTCGWPSATRRWSTCGRSGRGCVGRFSGWWTRVFFPLRESGVVTGLP